MNDISLMAGRVDEFVRLVGFCTEAGVYPALQSVSPDPNRDGALVLTIQNNHAAAPTDFDREIEVLQRLLGGSVVDLSFGDTVNQTRFVLVPNEGGSTNESL